MGADRRRARQEALVRALAAAELDGLLVTSRANIRYLTGFAGSAGLVAVTRADVLLVTDFRYGEQARAEAGAVARVEVEGTSVWDRFFKDLATLGPLTWVGYAGTGARAIRSPSSWRPVRGPRCRTRTRAGGRWGSGSGCCWTLGPRSTATAPTSRARWWWARARPSANARCTSWSRRPSG